MRLRELMREVKGASIRGDADVNGIAYDSREVLSGHLFVAIKGVKTDGHKFIEQALQRRASALVVEDSAVLDAHPEVAAAIVPDSRYALSAASQVFYGDPGAALLTVGITGTKGKTTVCHLIKSVLDTCGERTGLIGTVHNIVGDKVLPVTHTTPESVQLHRLLREMVDSGCTAAAMEVSSHALSLRRVEHIKFDVAVITNIGRDHLDFHVTPEAYMEAKAKLVRQVGDFPEKSRKFPPLTVLNLDDPAYGFFRSQTVTPAITYGFSKLADVRGAGLLHHRDGTGFTLYTGGRRDTVRLNLPGKFNVYNALAALSVGYGLGMDLDKAIAGLESVQSVRGRVERLEEATSFSVWVDYAHTPESLQSVLETARESTTGSVIVMFGCGGDRDPGKRPVMGRIASQMADYVIVTNDNPRTESEDAILNDIETGVKSGPSKPYRRVKDRREAIATALGVAKPGDIVVLAGKGHETYQIIGDRVSHFDDIEEARNILRAREGGAGL